MILTLPNILTLARVAVIPLFVGLFFLESAISQWIACGLFALAAITDFFDGYVARARAQLSAFGTFLDPTADKLLVASALLMMVGFGQELQQRGRHPRKPRKGGAHVPTAPTATAPVVDGKRVVGAPMRR